MIAVLTRRRPLQLPAAGRAAHMVERNAVLYRREWTLIVSGFFEPLLYLLAIGYGVGGLVGSAVTLNGRPIAYAAFVAPAMMASSAMNGAIYETAFNFFYKLKYVKLYDAILATPLGVADVYGIDDAHLAAYAAAAKTRDGFERYLDEYVWQRRKSSLPA